MLTNFEEEREVCLSLVSNDPYWDVVEVAVVNDTVLHWKVLVFFLK